MTSIPRPLTRSESDALVNTEGGSLERLLEIMARLRDPADGCPWDAAQTHASIARYAVEEAYELTDAIARDDPEDICDELGDMLLQVVFHARMAEEAGRFDITDVTRAISNKMRRRHPHVFEDADPAALDARWDEIKAAERAEKAARRGTPPARASVLDGSLKAQPALSRAADLKRRAARVGFDWPNADGVLDKVVEETAELVAEQKSGAAHDRLQDEFGDILLTLAVLGAHIGVDGEDALRGACDKFERRFRAVEAHLELDPSAPPRPLEELDAAWDAVKAEQREEPA